MTSVVIYTYYNSPSSNYNLGFFSKRLEEEIDYVFVINGFEYDKSIIIPTLPNVTVLRRENEGYDFGGHAHALEYLTKMGKSYDYYFFMNSGVIGPILPSYTNEKWWNIFIRKITDKVKLVGTSIVCLPPHDSGGAGPKVEGFFFMVDTVGLDLLRRRGTIFCNHASKTSAVIYGEYDLSKCIFENGYTIDCMLPRYKNIDWTCPSSYAMNEFQFPSRNGRYYGTSIQPYEVIFHKWHWAGEGDVNFDIVSDYVKGYDENEDQ